jgi:hypothetical protein
MPSKDVFNVTSWGVHNFQVLKPDIPPPTKYITFQISRREGITRWALQLILKPPSKPLSIFPKFLAKIRGQVSRLKGHKYWKSSIPRWVETTYIKMRTREIEVLRLRISGKGIFNLGFENILSINLMTTIKRWNPLAQAPGNEITSKIQLTDKTITNFTNQYKREEAKQRRI